MVTFVELECDMNLERRINERHGSWVMHPTTDQEATLFSRAAGLLKPGDKLHENDIRKMPGGIRLLLMAGGEGFWGFTGQRHQHCTYHCWTGGIALPIFSSDSEELTLFRSTLATSGLAYVGFADGGLEVYGTRCKFCAVQIIDSRYCADAVCASCIAACPHDWEPGHLVSSADGGIAMGDKCLRCGLQQLAATSDPDGVERELGLMVLRPGESVKEAVDAMLAPEPDFSEDK